MKNYYLAKAICLLTILIVGCDFSDNNVVDDIKQGNVISKDSNNGSTESQQKLAKPLNLNIPSETIELPQQLEKDFLAPIETQPISLMKPQPPVEKDLSISGKLHLDDDEQDYLEAVEGAEVQVEVKFK